MEMYFPPDQASMQPPAMIVVAAKLAKEKAIGVCLPVDNLSYASFGLAAQSYLIRYEGKDPMAVDISRVQFKVLAVTQQPKHGRLVMVDNDPYGSAAYRPDEGYYGKDRIEATVAVGNEVVRVVYNFVVQPKATDQLTPSEEKRLCPRGLDWKISGSSLEGVALGFVGGEKK